MADRAAVRIAAPDVHHSRIPPPDSPRGADPDSALWQCESRYPTHPPCESESRLSCRAKDEPLPIPNAKSRIASVTNPESRTPNPELLRLRRRRMTALEPGPFLLVRRADIAQGGAGSMHLHRVTRDVYADRSSHAVRFPLRDISFRIARRHEAVVVAAVPLTLAAAIARHVTEHLRMFGCELVD